MIRANSFKASRDFARKMDEQDPLASFRERFFIPKTKEGSKAIYFCGNSLGLQPRATALTIQQELKDWKNLGVEGHFHGSNPWFEYHKFLKPGLVELTGASDPSEVTPMGSLTTNLHLMMVSFYRPTQHRYKIIMESGAFPSDQYAIESQCRFHGLDPAQAIVELTPEPGKYYLETSRIIRSIEENSEQLALVLLSGVQYYSGQFFEIEPITRMGHDAGAYVGWDLAHAIGNVPLSLHQHQVDFAAWCSYKYLNSGPGGTAGIFVHKKHENEPDIPRFGGWWGYPETERFEMKKGFIPAKGADGWQVSNANILSMAAQKASLEIFLEAGITRIRDKSLLLTGYLEFLLNDLSHGLDKFKMITPDNPQNRGAQLSLLFNQEGSAIFRELTNSGIVVDWREPNIIRMAPAPLYNTFEEVYGFCQVLKTLIE